VLWAAPVELRTKVNSTVIKMDRKLVTVHLQSGMIMPNADYNSE